MLVETSGQLERVDRTLDRVGPNGRIALLARCGAPLTLRRVDHVITNNLSIIDRAAIWAAPSGRSSSSIETRGFRCTRPSPRWCGASTEERALDPAALAGKHCKLLARREPAPRRAVRRAYRFG